MSMLLLSSIVCAGYVVSAMMGKNEEVIEPIKETNKYEKYQMDTFEYFNNLPLEYQEQYFEDHLDLRDYKDDARYGFTNDKYRNAKHAAELSRLFGKPFTDRYKTYNN